MTCFLQWGQPAEWKYLLSSFKPEFQPHKPTKVLSESQKITCSTPAAAWAATIKEDIHSNEILLIQAVTGRTFCHPQGLYFPTEMIKTFQRHKREELHEAAHTNLPHPNSVAAFLW